MLTFSNKRNKQIFTECQNITLRWPWSILHLQIIRKMNSLLENIHFLRDGDGILDKDTSLKCVYKPFILYNHCSFNVVVNLYCTVSLSRHVEDSFIQFQKTAKDVEGLEEEAFCLTDVLILSVHREHVFLYTCQPDNRPPSFDFTLKQTVAGTITHSPLVVSLRSLCEGRWLTRSKPVFEEHRTVFTTVLYLKVHKSCRQADDISRGWLNYGWHLMVLQTGPFWLMTSATGKELLNWLCPEPQHTVRAQHATSTSSIMKKTLVSSVLLWVMWVYLFIFWGNDST